MFFISCLASFQVIAAAQDCAADKAHDELNFVEGPTDLEADTDLQFTSLLQIGIQIAGTQHKGNNSVAEQQTSPRFDCMPQMKELHQQWGDTFDQQQMTPMDRSQFWQSSIIHEAFFGSGTVPIKRGTVLEIGADEGLAGSNSYAFEIGFGWRTILIEANPDSARALKRNRPGAEVHAPMAVSPSSGHVNFSICDDAALGHITVDDAPCNVTEIIQVPSEPMSAFLKDVPELDILFLDVEGAERMVLETIDFSTTKINVLNVEAGCPGSEAGDFLQSKGFVFRGNIMQDYVWSGAGVQLRPPVWAAASGR